MTRACCVANGARSRCRATPRKCSRQSRMLDRQTPTAPMRHTTSPSHAPEPSVRGRRKPNVPRRIFVLDTNVLMHDPAAIFRFEEHDIFIPMTVLEELDAGKKGVSESARNVRQVSRFLDELMGGADK